MKLVKISFPTQMKMEEIRSVHINESIIKLKGLQRTIFDLFGERMHDIQSPHGFFSQVVFKTLGGMEITTTEDLRNHLQVHDSLSVSFFKEHP